MVHPKNLMKTLGTFVTINSTKLKKNKLHTASEQNEAVNNTLSYFASNPNGKFLWNAKPRFGKTLTTYDLAVKMDALKVLVVTNRPAIANSWFDDFENLLLGKPTLHLFLLPIR